MRASDKVYNALRREIVEWKLSPGAVLAEVELSERLGVSRTPVREALAKLIADGLATQQGGRGTVVSEASLDSIEDIFVLRKALETESARLAATSRNTEPFRELAETFTKVAQAQDHNVDTDAYYSSVEELDQRIDDAANNAYLSSALENLRVHLERIRRKAKDNPQRLIASAREHAHIAESIANKNPELAVAATILHLQQSLNHILDHSVR